MMPAGREEVPKVVRLITPLPEIREADASGDVADIYDQLRRGLRLPIFNLIYRHFATIPGGLRFVWSRLSEPLRDGSLDQARERLAARLEIANAVHLDSTALRAAAANPSDQSDILAITALYNRGNITNLIGLTAIRMLLDAPMSGTELLPSPARWQSAEEPHVDIRPLPRIDALSPDSARLVRSLAAHHSGAASGVTPSLYLHLGYWPDFLAALAHGLAAPFADGSFARAGDMTRQFAEHEAAALLPAMRSSPPAPSGVASAIEPTIHLFTRKVIPEMVPIGLAISGALTIDRSVDARA
jgi:hypothetical protein